MEKYHDARAKEGKQANVLESHYLTQLCTLPQTSALRGSH